MQAPAPEQVAYEALIEFLYRAPIGLLQARPDGEVTMINPMSAQLLMPLVPTGDLGNLFDVLAPVAPGLRALAAQHTTPGSVVCDALRLPLPAAAGRPPQTLALSITRLDDATLMCSLSDVSHAVREEQHRLAAQRRDLGRTDALTALPNRAVVREHIARMLALQQDKPDLSMAVLFINIDRFNQVNLAHGAAQGDAVLRQMAQRLGATLRPGDAVGRAVPPASTAARLGGDEFVVVLEGLRGADDAQRIARRLVDALSRPYDIDGLVLHLGVSVGISLGGSAPDADADSVLQDAGIAMREAKRAGGGRHAVFDPAMKVRATYRGLVETELRQALDQGELFVVYQPIVALGGGSAVGVEALVRWQHRLRGMVPPLAFIDIAEQTGLIGALGVFVLETACRQFMQWRQALGALAPQGLSVNLSRAQLADPQLVAQVQRALRASAMPATALQLEVTESLAAQDDTVRDRLQALKALGLSLALDDFGTGYSSLSSLHQLPVDLVKIDRSFVSQLETSAHHRALVKATVEVAQSLGMGTVAEGIETPGQAQVLQALQSQKGQGY
ncbi:MAG: EAL domain-containing protein, partial [Burkholderiaceae bacterium]|nr:EAL domain-containing protein [Burkholderiaceae bacterium]